MIRSVLRKVTAKWRVASVTWVQLSIARSNNLFLFLIFKWLMSPDGRSASHVIRWSHTSPRKHDFLSQGRDATYDKRYFFLIISDLCSVSCSPVTWWIDFFRICFLLALIRLPSSVRHPSLHNVADYLRNHFHYITDLITFPSLCENRCSSAYKYGWRCAKARERRNAHGAQIAMRWNRRW